MEREFGMKTGKEFESFGEKSGRKKKGGCESPCDAKRGINARRVQDRGVLAWGEKKRTKLWKAWQLKESSARKAVRKERKLDSIRKKKDNMENFVRFIIGA